MTSKTQGWANKLEDGTIDLATVGPTSRSVMVNALWNAKVVVMDSFSDKQIEDLYKGACKKHKWTLIKVDITEQPSTH